MRAVVCVKQVIDIDPRAPGSSIVLDQAGKRIEGAAGSRPLINEFDEQALEAALRLREQLGELEVIALSVGAQFNQDVMKRALAAGADDLVLVQDASLDTWDSRHIAVSLAAAIRYLGGADLVVCGRQASDWDNALVPFVLAEELGMACLSLARQVIVNGDEVEVERVLADGVQVASARLPAVVTVTSELGMLRYPTALAKLAAARRQARHLGLVDIGVPAEHVPAVEVVGLAFPEGGRDCRFVEAADGAEAGRRLAGILLEAGKVHVGGGA
ncbi:MAG: electron transfer flavoprotein subunit beta/FixA family protein [Acidimicrobiales bacterium]